MRITKRKQEPVYNIADEYFKKDIINILSNGYMDENPRPHWGDGTPAFTKSVNHVVRTYDLNRGEFPFCTLRGMSWKSAIKEVQWIYQDQTSDLEILKKKYNNHVWDQWESKDIPKTIGCRYGHTVKKYDLMNNLLNGLKNNPFGRRHIIDLWQEEEFESSDGLNPCAFMTTWNVRKNNNEYYLDMVLYQRSGDMLVASGAGNYNEIQYAALLLMVAKHCNYKPGVFTHFVANEQIYDRFFDNARDLLNRKSVFCNPQIVLDTNKTNFYDFTIDDFKLINCDIEQIKKVNPQIKFEVAI